MDEERRKAYSEVVEILKLIDDEEKLEKLPFEVVELIKTNSDPTYKPEISKDIPLEEQNLRDETYGIIGWLANKYWGEEIKEAENLQEGDKIKEVNLQKSDKIKETENLQESDKINEVNIQEINKIDEDNIQKIDKIHEEENDRLNKTNEIKNKEVENNLPIVVEEIKWYQKIKIKVINFLKSIFRINNKERGVV